MKNQGRSNETNKTIKEKFVIMGSPKPPPQIFNEEVEINATDQVGLVVTGPVTGVGAGA